MIISELEVSVGFCYYYYYYYCRQLCHIESNKQSKTQQLSFHTFGVQGSVGWDDALTAQLTLGPRRLDRKKGPFDKIIDS